MEELVMLDRPVSLLVFTDLDGSLLDHNTYQWAAAQQGLDALQTAGIPIIIMSSKTAVEIDSLASQLGLADYPYSAENGAVIHLPLHCNRHTPDCDSSGVITLGSGADKLHATLEALRAQGFAFEGFSDVSAQMVAEWTGLSLDKASQAQQREASEPLRWLGDEASLHRFRQALDIEGFALQRGGRFYHVMPLGTNKGVALQWLMNYYRAQHEPRKCGASLKALALGDGENDLSMLMAADYGVLIRSPAGSLPQVDSLPDSIYKTRRFGPEGWMEGMRYWYRGLVT